MIIYICNISRYSMVQKIPKMYFFFVLFKILKHTVYCRFKITFNVVSYFWTPLYLHNLMVGFNVFICIINQTIPKNDYCFTAPADPKFPTASKGLCSSSCKGGLVSMKSVKHFIGQKPYCVLRLKTRRLPPNFSQNVEEMMDYEGDYHVLNNNCLHFALRLLGVGKKLIFLLHMLS